jgi:uncharacterized protein
MPTYDVPGVYIEEITGPGVIAGVGTSTAGFVGPALNGSLNVANRISSWDEFLKTYALLQADGSYLPYIVTPRLFYLAHGVRSFFENGGAQAYIVRIGTAKNTQWSVVNGHTPAETVFRLQAKQEGTAGDNIKVDLTSASYTTTPATPNGAAVATGKAKVTNINGIQVTVDDSTQFQPGDIVTKDESSRGQVTLIQGSVLTLSNPINLLQINDSIRIANILPSQYTFRMADTTGLLPGTVAVVSGDDADHPGTARTTDYVVVQSIDQAGFVTVQGTPPRTYKYNLDPLAATPTRLSSQEFELTITPPVGVAEVWNNLSLDPRHPNYVFSYVQSDLADILPPFVPPIENTYPNILVKVPAAPTLAPTVNGAADDPSSLTAADYSSGLDVLQDIEDVELLVIPDASTSDWNSIQNDMIDHCLAKGDRFAILDSRPNSVPTGAGSVDEQCTFVRADRGFAALYYPWLVVTDPMSKPTATNPIPANMTIPPSGAIAGVYARTDQAIGVHKAPANTNVRGVLGLERKLSDRQQGPLNLDGVDVLRIFPGSGQVTVWGARTTVDPNTTDWIYVNVRRLMIYLEQSIEVGIRWAVFEPNGPPLWQKLKRTITEFLTRVWRDGALFGTTAEQAFYVRIDEALNPPSTRALGRLYIEIGVAAVRPAEFIIVRIGLWDGGDQVTES